MHFFILKWLGEIILPLNSYLEQDAFSRFVIMSRDKLKVFADTLGSIDYTLSEDISYQQEQETVHLSAGKQRLTGELLLSLLNNPHRLIDLPYALAQNESLSSSYLEKILASDNNTKTNKR